MHALMIRATLMAMLLLGLLLALIHVETRDRIDTHISVARNAATETRHAAVAANPTRPITLPTVYVRISPAEMARIGHETVERAATVPTDFTESNRVGPSLYRTLSPALPQVRLDMPYYSFGKSLSRAHRD